MVAKKREIIFYSDVGWARVEDPRIPGWAWVGLFRQADGRIRVGTVVLDQAAGRIGNPGAGLPITMEIMRALNLVEVEREANRIGAGLGDLNESIPWVDVPGNDPIGIIRKTLGGTKNDPKFSGWVGSKPRSSRHYRLTSSPPGGRIPDEYLNRVVRAYHSAIAYGFQPAPTIAKDAGVSVHTARSWIKKARARGLMPPGRAGHTG